MSGEARKFSDAARTAGGPSDGFSETQTQVLAKAAAGNWGPFFDQYLRPCWREVVIACRSRQIPLPDADDLYQELMLRLLRDAGFTRRIRRVLSQENQDPDFRGNLPARYLKHRELSLRSAQFRTYLSGITRNPHTLASHRASRGNPDALRSHLSLAVRVKELAEGLEVVVEVGVHGIGHRIPTGYPSRALILWVRAVSSDSRPLKLLQGPVLPPLAGQGAPAKGGLARQLGRMYAKVLESLDGRQPVPYWRPNRVKYYTRLLPDQTDRVRFLFRRPRGKATVVAQLIYRRFSKYLADQKGWPDNEFVVALERWSSPVGNTHPETARRCEDRQPSTENTSNAQ